MLTGFSPPELRDGIYSYLTIPEPSSYDFAPVKVDLYTRFILLAIWVFRLSPFSIPYLVPIPMRPKPTRKLLNTMCLVSKQFKEEYMDIYCRRATFHFTLDASLAPSERPFKIAPDTLSRVRKCALRILATPGIVGAFDPREATGDWLLRDKVFEAMADMASLRDMTLSIQACGNQLWNPLWLWHFTSQAFKESKVKAFRRIDFTLEGWTLKEPNHMARNADGGWEWQCAEGHRVQEDREGQIPVRQFCGALYAECRVCSPLGDEDQE